MRTSWKSASGGGIVAVGRVDPAVIESAPDLAGDSYYREKEDFSTVEPRVQIAVERVLDSPLARDMLQADPVLSELGFSALPMQLFMR